MRPETDQQRMLSDAARQFAGRRSTSARVRSCRDRIPDFDADVWRELAQLGWLSVLAPEVDGGLGAGLSEMGQLVYEWGAACAPEPLVATGVLALRMLIEANGPARGPLLEAAIAGTCIPALARMNSGACTRHTDCWEVSGNSRLVVPAEASDFLLVFEAALGAPCLRLRADTPGLSITRERRVDGTGAASFSIAGVRIGDENVVCDGTCAPAAAALAQDCALVMTAVQMTGTMKAINELTLQYLRTREQFGKAIGSFQALQHKAVDMYIAEQLARDVAQNACAVLDAGVDASERACIASRAKACSCDALDKIARMGVQLHGAMGYTDEYDLSLHLNRALVLSAWLGNADEHVGRYARHAPQFTAANT